MMRITAIMPETTLPDVRCDAQPRAAAGRLDEEAFRSFYERTARQVWAYLVRLTGDAALADDLLQEAYYRFYRAGATHEDERHRRNSLYRIATNLARDHGRRRSHVREVALPDEFEEIATADTGDRVNDRTDLRRALALMRPVDREILWLAYAQGSSHDEIAEIVGASRKSIKSLLFRARKKLAELLRAGGTHHA